MKKTKQNFIISLFYPGAHIDKFTGRTDEHGGAVASTQRLRPSLRCFTVITICYSIPSLPSHHFHAIHLYNKILLHIALAKHRNYFLLLHNDVFMSCRHNTKCSYSFYFLICLRLIAVCQGWKESGWCLLCSKCMHRTGDPTR